jgi:hypothetical protein
MKNSSNGRLIRILVLAACLLTDRGASAQGGNGDSSDGDDWVPVKHLEFTPEDVAGGLLGPEGELIEVVQRATQPSLIEIRQGFEAEVVKTMENM